MDRRVAYAVRPADSVPVRRRSMFRRARAVALPLSFLACLLESSPSHGGEGSGCCNGDYVAVIAGIAEGANRVVDTEGFAHWGMPGWITRFNDNSSMLGLRAGRILTHADRSIRFEFGLNFTDAKSSSNLLDPRIPVGHDETAVSEPKWIATAQFGLDQDIGQLTVFALAGLAAGRMHNSVTDLDWVRDDLNSPYYQDQVRLGCDGRIGIPSHQCDLPPNGVAACRPREQQTLCQPVRRRHMRTGWTKRALPVEVRQRVHLLRSGTGLPPRRLSSGLHAGSVPNREHRNTCNPFRNAVPAPAAGAHRRFGQGHTGDPCLARPDAVAQMEPGCEARRRTTPSKSARWGTGVHRKNAAHERSLTPRSVGSRSSIGVWIDLACCSGCNGSAPER